MWDEDWFKTYWEYKKSENDLKKAQANAAKDAHLNMEYTYRDECIKMDADGILADRLSKAVAGRMYMDGAAVLISAVSDLFNPLSWLFPQH